jgi:hypothetical protein
MKYPNKKQIKKSYKTQSLDNPLHLKGKIKKNHLKKRKIIITTWISLPKSQSRPQDYNDPTKIKLIKNNKKIQFLTNAR